MAAIPKMLRAGDNALLLECEDLGDALRVFSALQNARDRGHLTVDDLVPAARTVLVRGGEAAAFTAFAPKLSEILAQHVADTTEHDTSTSVTIPVIYNGDDLADVAQLTQLSEEEVIARHVAAEYRVAFTGFAPGFAYLAGGDSRLTVPRRAAPRTRIPAGAVGLAGEFSGVYPRSSPGGWQLIGQTYAAMWDLEREQPALLRPGAAVQFVVERERVSAGSVTPVPTVQAETPVSPQVSAPSRATNDRDSSRPAAPARAAAKATPRRTAVLTVANPGLQTLVQDDGRPGHAAMGVAPGGAADKRALHDANRLVGNAPGAAALELAYGGFAASAIETTVLAFEGAIRSARVTNDFGSRVVSAGQPFRVARGDLLEFGMPPRGIRTVVAIRGGIDAAPVLGSASRDTLAELGPAPLTHGSVLYAGRPTRRAVALGPDALARPLLPARGDTTVFDVIAGPRDDWFSAESLNRFFSTEFTVTPQSDRVGVRLSGPPLLRKETFQSCELPSEGLATGSIQVTSAGQPVIFLADMPLTGGYPVIAVIAAHHQHLAAQLPPESLVRFTRYELD